VFVEISGQENYAVCMQNGLPFIYDIYVTEDDANFLVEGGDKAAAGAKALLASRTNTLFSAPMLFGMLAGPHYGGYVTPIGGTGLIVALVIIVALEINGLKGKQGPMTTVNGVIGSSLALTAILVCALKFL